MSKTEGMRVTLKTARELSGLNQEEAAKILEITADTLRSYEKGKTYPDIPMLRKIEKLYHVSYSQIIFLPMDFN